MMKKTVLFATLLLSCFSCKKELTEDFSSAAEVRYTVTASIEADSRVTINAGGKATWEEGDAIGVFIDGSIVKFTLSDGDGTATGTFSSSFDVRGKTVNGVAVYPYDASLSLNGKSVTVKAAASNNEGTTFPAPMVATMPADGQYAFRNIAAILRVQYTNLPSMAQKVKLTASNTLSGTFTLPDYETSQLALPTTTGNNVLQAYLPKVRLNHTAYVDFPIPAGTLTSIKAELLDVEGQVIDTRNASASKTFVSGVIKPLEAIDLEGARMSVNWVWDAGSLPSFHSNVPAIDDNGNVFVSTNEGALYKIDNQGHELWRADLSGMGGTVDTSPAIEADGSTAYIAGGQDSNGTLYAINADGSVKWIFSDYPWSDVQPKRNFWQTFIGVGTDNIYVPVGTLSTLLTVKKADGSRVCYGSGKTSGTNGGVSGPDVGCAIGLGGTVSMMTRYGTFNWNKKLLDNPTQNNGAYGKFATYGFQDLWIGWGSFGQDKQGVICAKKGPSSGENVIISCAQENNARMDICCYPASYTINNTLARHDDNQYKYYWRHRISDPETADENPQTQDQGGIVMGHENLVVIVPMKNKSNTSTPNTGRGGLYTVWMGRNASIGDGGTACWRVATSEDVSGAAAVDNNGNVHFTTNKYYYIVKPNTNAGGSYTILHQIYLRYLLLGSGFVDNVTYTNVWSSVKIANDGKIYLNINLKGKDGNYRGVTACLSYPGVTGPDPTSSWPQKGADPYNSCCQQL